MATKLAKELKRELEVDGSSYMLTITPEGLRLVEGQVLRENTTMIEICRKLGFTVRADANDPEIKIVTLPLTEVGQRLSA